jgi:hypothetical protein
VRESEAVRDHIDALQQAVNGLKESVEQASRETSQKITARVEQVNEPLNRQSDSAIDAGQAEDHSQNQWQAMEAQAAAKMRDLHDRAERKRGEVKGDVADDDARSAEGAAVDTLDYASWTVQQAELSVLLCDRRPHPGRRTGSRIRSPLSGACARKGRPSGAHAAAGIQPSFRDAGSADRAVPGGVAVATHSW